MKRSEINKAFDYARDFFLKHHFYLPAWAYLTPDEWKTKGIEYDEVRNNGLGWDIVDFGMDDFKKDGLTLFTIRNGDLTSNEMSKTYCEKIMISYVKQVTQTHFHWKKVEDIINRGGGDLMIRLWKADNKTEEIMKGNFLVSIDGVQREVQQGETVCLKPGESITLKPYIYHSFWAEGEDCLIGEVSTVNDDVNDNRFIVPQQRFPKIEEDEPSRYCLCNELPKIS